MPNYCEVSLKLKHENKDLLLKAIQAYNRGDLLNTFIPEPDYETTEVPNMFPEFHDGEKYAKDDKWWNWRNVNWGTKWEIRQPYTAEDVEKDELDVYFTTAWSPPVPLFHKLYDLGFEVEATYAEMGVGFCGEFSDGDDYEYYIDEYSKSWIEDNIPMEIIDNHSLLDAVEWEDEDEMEEDNV